LQEIVRLFLAEYPGRVAALRRALDAHDYQTARIVAHSLKGSLRVLGAVRAAAVATALERKAQEEMRDAAREAGAQLDEEISRVIPALQRLAAGTAEAAPSPSPHG
jgi:HPt (histidine-containing phosphotransfer) domain-containing protein